MLTDPNEKLDAMSLLFYMSSVSIMLLLPASALLEPSAFNKVWQHARAHGGLVKAASVLAAPVRPHA